MTRKTVALLILGSSLFLAGCNTVKGAGRDVQSVGAAVERTAD